MNKTQRIAIDGVLSALAFGLSYIELLIPFDFAIPGIKLGLANLIIVFSLYRLRPQDALVINVVRVVLAGLLFGNFMAFSFSIAGAICSFVIMFVLKQFTDCHVVIISVAGAIAHVCAQMLIGLFYYSSSVIYYYSMYLLIASVITGILLGIIANLLLKYIRLNMIGNNVKEI